MKKSIIIITIIAILSISTVSAYKYLKIDFDKGIEEGFVNQLTEEEYNEYVDNNDLIDKGSNGDKASAEALLMIDSLNEKLDNLNNNN